MSDDFGVFEREIFIAASPETVFGFLIDPELMAEWFGSTHTLQPHPGGIFRVECSHGNIACGVYTEVAPYERVAFTWGWESPDQTLARLKPGSSLVEIQLEPKNGGTLLRFRHSGLPETLRTMHGDHWSEYLVILAEAAAIREKEGSSSSTRIRS